MTSALLLMIIVPALGAVAALPALLPVFCGPAPVTPSGVPAVPPATAVPEAIVSAHTTLIHKAISISLPAAGAGVRRKERNPGRSESWPA